jgi:hypothetical protein
LILAIFAASASAGAWTRGFGDYYAHIGADYYVPRVYVDPLTGRAVETNRRYLGQQYGFYGELGVSKGWKAQVGLVVPFSIGSLTFEAPGGMGRATTWRAGDARIFGQVAVARKLPIAAIVEVKVPLYANDDVGKNQGVYQPDFPKPGDGQVDTGVWLTAGAGIPKTALWAEGALGWVHRSEWFVGWDTDVSFTDGIGLNGTFGGKAGKLIAMVKIDGRVNPVDDDLTREWIAVGPAVLYDIHPKLSLEARVSYDVWAAHAASGVGFGLALSSRRPQ